MMICVAAIGAVLGSVAVLFTRPTFLAMLIAVNLICLAIPTLFFGLLGLVSSGLQGRRRRDSPIDPKNDFPDGSAQTDRED